MALALGLSVCAGLASSPAGAASRGGTRLPTQRAVVISIDGASPRFVEEYLASGDLPANEGLGLLKRKGLYAKQVITTSPSLTAVAHIAIATGSSAPQNDIVGNSFHLHASPFSSNISGFGAPIGGYELVSPGPAVEPTATPLWIPLLAAGKTVVAATFPGADGATVTVPGAPAPAPVLQASSLRTVSYTIPFGAFGGQGAVGFQLTAASFRDAAPELVAALEASSPGPFYGTVKQADLETITVNGLTFAIDVAALDTTDDDAENYDTLVFFDETNGITPGPFALPSTGPAYVNPSDEHSEPFYFEGTPNRVGAAFYVSHLDPALGVVRVARYSANFIPRNAPVIANVDDMNTNVGFWAPQPDFRIPERLSPGFGVFSDAELEAIYADQVETFTDYQTRMAKRAIEANPDADLVLLYFEQPDGSFHQFLLTDPRQPTNPLDPNSIREGQDQAKIARYAEFRKLAYQTANRGVDAVIRAVGVDSRGIPKRNVFVVSDHGFETFHSAVSLANFITGYGDAELRDTTKVRFVTSGPAVNAYVNLVGRNNGGTVPASGFVALKEKIATALRSFVDSNPNYVSAPAPVFDQVEERPVTLPESDPGFGLEKSEFIGQDSGDVYALLEPGYNFDGTQSPVVLRKGDAASTTPPLSVPNFYGAHGYDPELPNLSAILYAAGPAIPHKTIRRSHTVDVAPTILALLDVEAPDTVEGTPIDLRDSSGCIRVGSASGSGGAALAVGVLITSAAFGRRRRKARKVGQK
jgi:predicted AlkP superfamily pyrophosphatase or phosphodiesterase